jgi:uncharacterized membrane protein
MSRSRKPKSPAPKPVNKALSAHPIVPPSPNGGAIRNISIQQQFSGPLPPPEILIKYNDVVPNGGERIIEMAEKQQNHRISLEKFALESDAKRANLGLILGFILALLVAVGGIWIVLMGKDIAGLSMIFVPLAALVGVFITAQRVRKAEREARNKTLLEKAASKKT